MSERISGVRIPLPPPRFDKNLLICFNLSMDPTYEDYKNKTGARITKIMGESLLHGIITEEQAGEISAYLLENIDLAKTNSELFDFVTNLSAKWPIFNSILTSSDQVQVSLSTVNTIQEKTDQIIHTTEDLIKENKIDEALQVAKTAAGNLNQNPPTGMRGGI